MREEGLQCNWAVVVAYRQAPKNAAGKLERSEKKKLMSEFNKTEKQIRRIIYLANLADAQGVALDLSDGRNSNTGRPSGLTPKIEAAMKSVNTANLKKKLRSTRRRMQTALKKQGIKLALSTVHQYILLLKGKLAKWHVKFSLTGEQMRNRLDYVNAQIIPGTER